MWVNIKNPCVAIIKRNNWNQFRRKKTQLNKLIPKIFDNVKLLIDCVITGGRIP